MPICINFNRPIEYFCYGLDFHVVTIAFVLLFPHYVFIKILGNELRIMIPFLLLMRQTLAGEHIVTRE